jgi:UDP-N-acetylmuramoyl-tripeptide--D-alanyl-D-alanine ligase
VVRLSNLESDELGRPAFDLTFRGETERVALQLLGEHQATNAAAVAATALAAGLPFDRVAATLGAITSLSKWRMELRERGDGLAVVNDAYNANPDSMRAALRTLAGIGARTGRRTVAVLGEMRELGDSADAEHRTVGTLARELGVDQLYVVGPGARGIAEGDPRAAYAETLDELVEQVRNNVSGSEVVLVKASRAAGLERVAAALLDDPTETKEAVR